MNKGLKIFLIVLAVLLVLIAAVAIWGISYYNKMMNKMNIITLPEDTYVYTEETTAPAQKEQAEVTEATEATTVETTYWGGYKDIYGDGFEHSVLEFDAGQNKKLIRAITEAEG